MEKESLQFRDNLAKEIKNTFNKHERREILQDSKAKPEYWGTREEKIRERQNEEEIDNGLGILLKNKILYHGSPISGIKKFNSDLIENTTVGDGMYFTSEAKKAIGYGRIRSGNKNNIIYEVTVNNLKLLNLRINENVKKVFDLFKDKLLNKLNNLDPKKYSPLMFDVLKDSYIKAIDNIEKGNYDCGQVRRIVHNTSGVNFGYDFAKHVKEIGYDGLVTFEGGENEETSEHDTYMIFNLEKVKINREHKIL